MDRRKFLWSVGAAGTASAMAGGLAIRESGNARARADGLQTAATRKTTASHPSVARTGNAVNEGLLLGYLSGSAALLANPAVERRILEMASGLPWSRWDQVASQASTRSLFKRSTTVDLSIGTLQRASALVNTLQSLEIVAHFAIDEAPYFAPFGAWSFRAGTLATKQSMTQALTFTAEMPNRVALEVNYALNPMAIAGGTKGEGSLYLPVGRDGATGLSTGLYVLAAGSPETGVAPDLSAWMFSSDMHAPLADRSGGRPNFDYLTLAIRPVAI